MNNILIVNYDFPPNKGIGGRRWAIFAKYLTAKGINVHVLKRATLIKQSSNFLEYVENNKRIVTGSFPSFYPEILNKRPHGVIPRFFYNISKYFMYLASRGTPYDRALLPGFLFEWIMWRRARKTKAAFIVVSGAPFKLCYFATRNRNRHNIPVIVDFRDPWTWGRAYGFVLLGKKRFEVEKQMERVTVCNADLITVPAEPMLEYLKTTYPEYASKMVLLKHGFDPDLIKRYDFNRFKTKSVINLVHIGTIRDGIESTMHKIAKVLDKALGKIRLTFYTDENKYETVFDKYGLLGNSVQYRKTLNQKDFFHKLEEYDFVFMAHPPNAKNDLVTKVFEIIYSRTPIIYVGDSGLLSDFLVNNKCGLFFDLDHVEDELSYECLSSTMDFDGFDGIEDYSFARLTEYFLETTEKKLGIS